MHVEKCGSKINKLQFKEKIIALVRKMGKKIMYYQITVSYYFFSCGLITVLFPHQG